MNIQIIPINVENRDEDSADEQAHCVGRKQRKPRFSKATLIARLQQIMFDLERDYSFKPGDGWASVERRPTVVKVQFGRYDLARDLIDDLDGGYT